MASEATIRLREETLPPHDPSHGTPHAMRRRVLEFELPQGRATFEQTDYGHPGRLNPWEPRHIDMRLQTNTAHLLVAAEAIGGLLK
jgi:hypothetical protein